MTAQTLHATCVSIEGRGVLLLGEPGSGKSSLALQLIDRGASLVADDQVQFSVEDGKLLATAPQRLRGRIEAFGVGILTQPYAPVAPVALAVRLVQANNVERMPEPQSWSHLGVRVPLLSLHAFDASTVAKIRLFMK